MDDTAHGRSGGVPPGRAPAPETPERWGAREADLLGTAEELEVATWRHDDRLSAWVPIWVVVVDHRAYVRTWHRRSTGWFGRAVARQRALVRVPGLETDVRVEDLGHADGRLRREIDAAYRAKYHRHGAPVVARMTTEQASAATLRFTSQPSQSTGGPVLGSAAPDGGHTSWNSGSTSPTSPGPVGRPRSQRP